MLNLNFVIIASLFLLSLSAMAAPHTGEKAIFSAVGTENGQAFTGTFSMELVEYNEELKSYLVRSIEKADGAEEKSEEEMMPESQIANEEKIRQALDSCVTQEGILENVTVPAGTFEACTLPLRNEEGGRLGTVSMANVPFGFVRLEKTDAEGTLKLELKEFRKN